MSQKETTKDSDAIAEDVLVIDPPKKPRQKPLRVRMDEATPEEQVEIRLDEEKDV